jgi:hypothetical protein
MKKHVKMTDPTKSEKVKTPTMVSNQLPMVGEEVIFTKRKGKTVYKR